MRSGRLLDWLLLGLAIGIALWAKYFVVVLVVPLGLFLLIDRDARRALATPGPWLALAVALVTMAPHLVWLVRNDFLPFAYASARSVPSRGAIDHLLHPLVFTLSQVGALAPALAIALPLRWPRPAEAPATAVDAFDRVLRISVDTGAVRDAARARMRLRELGVRRRVQSLDRPKLGWESLTAAELQVARLAAAGCTNRAIADRLFVSPHTVNTHLRHAFDKLDIRSRVDLTRLVERYS